MNDIYLTESVWNTSELVFKTAHIMSDEELA
jgi:hypothetical protein